MEADPASARRPRRVTKVSIAAPLKLMDELLVECPVVKFAERKTVRRNVQVVVRPRENVRGINTRHVTVIVLREHEAADEAG